jgi:hypothetical protein
MFDEDYKERVRLVDISSENLLALSSRNEKEHVWTRDVLVGQPVLANQQQSLSLGDVLGTLHGAPHMSFRWAQDQR